MDGYVSLIVGLGLGFLLMWLLVSIRDYWKQSKALRSASAKARKEVQEKAIKARQDAQKARGAVIDAALRAFILLLTLAGAVWVFWMFVTL
jgi:hypothetical protein